MFPLWLAVVIIFFVRLLTVNTDEPLLLLGLCNDYSLNTTVSWLVNTYLYHAIPFWLVVSSPSVGDNLMGIPLHVVIFPLIFYLCL